LAAQLFALPAHTAPLFLFGRGHAHHRQGLAIARQVAVQATDQFGRIGLVGVHTLAQGVELHRPDDVTVHAPVFELPGQNEATGTGFINGVDLLGHGQLLFDEALEVRARIDALRWLGARSIELTHDPQIGRVLIDAQQNPLVSRFSHLRIVPLCVDL
jgi:hypothetical protein